MDLAIREFASKIVNEINNNPLPIEVKRLVIKDIYAQIEKIADGVIMQTVSQRNKQETVDEATDKHEETTE